MSATADSSTRTPHPSPAKGELAGLRIAVTRPAHQADALIERIRAAGGEAIAQPLLAIAPPDLPVSADALRAKAQRAERIIFISPNAVRMALGVLPASHWRPLPMHGEDWGGEKGQASRIAAIGKGTARALHEAGFSDVLAPRDGADSEALLALPEFADMRGRTLLIVRGEGGRDLLATTLEARGAAVIHAVVYRRLPRPPDIALLRAGGPTIFMLTSSEALRVLLDAAQGPDDAAWLRGQRYVFGHPRIAALGRTEGLVHGIIVKSPEDDALYAALVSLAELEKNTP
ncbi:MAG: uroporphyrinogen-III synthase [Halothiobacillaceae bacterium]|nr:MAG: uroporphyrinogen-III synthase [Halothiobacillaceae bacterium]